jgi:hypothetical protein
MKELISVKGVLTIFLKMPWGLLPIYHKCNMVTDLGKQKLLSHLSSAGPVTPLNIAKFRIGQGGNDTPSATSTVVIPPVASQTDLLDKFSDGLYDQAIGAPSVSGNSLVFSWSLDDDAFADNSMFINEAGMYLSDETLFSVRNFPSIVKPLGISLVFQWTISLG